MKGRITIEAGVVSQSIQEQADELVAKAAAGSFPVDPLIGPTLSRSFSIVASVVRRHGFMIQAQLARALQQSGLYEVLTNVAVPVPTEPGGRPRSLSVDLVAINPASSWIGAYEIKRGLGSTETAKRKLIEHDLKAIRAILPTFALDLGYEGVRYADSAVISYYDGAMFKAELTLRRCDLDDHFEASVVEAVDAMTAAIGRALKGAVPDLFGFKAPIGPRAASDPVAPPPGPRRPIGPGQARRLLESGQGLPQ